MIVGIKSYSVHIFIISSTCHSQLFLNYTVYSPGYGKCFLGKIPVQMGFWCSKETLNSNHNTLTTDTV